MTELQVQHEFNTPSSVFNLQELPFLVGSVVIEVLFHPFCAESKKIVGWDSS